MGNNNQSAFHNSPDDICNFSRKVVFFKVIVRQDISSTGVFSRAGVVPAGLGVGEVSCLGTISMGICKAEPSCLKANSLLTQVSFSFVQQHFL